MMEVAQQTGIPETTPCTLGPENRLPVRVLNLEPLHSLDFLLEFRASVGKTLNKGLLEVDLTA